MAFQGRRYLGVENRIQNFEDNRSETNQPIITRYIYAFFISGSQKSIQGIHAQYTLDRLNVHWLLAIKLSVCATLPLSNMELGPQDLLTLRRQLAVHILR